MSRSDVERVFIGWDAQVLARAANTYLDRFRSLSPLEMQDVLVGVPGGQAGRMFLREIARQASGTRPRIVTPGRLPDLLLGIEGQGAPDSVLRLIWREAIEQCGDAVIARLGGLLDATDRARIVDSLARRIQIWHRELSGDGMRLRDAAERLNKDGIGLIDRMAAAGEVELVYESLIKGHGLRDQQLVRLNTLEYDGCTFAHTLVLVCTPELGGLARAVVEQHYGKTIALIAAPESHAAGFDPIGCVAPSYWQDIDSPIPDNGIRFEETEQACAAYALAAVARDAGETSADGVRFAVTDPKLATLLEREAGKYPDINLRTWTGRALSRSRIGVLIDCLTRHIAEHTFETYAALVRHPDIEKYVDASLGTPQAHWIEHLDVFQSEFLPRGVPQQWKRPSRNKNAEMLTRVASVIDDLMMPLISASGHSEKLGSALISILQSLYADLDTDADQEPAQACGTVVEIIDRFASTLSQVSSTVDTVTYLGMVSEELDRTNTAPPQDANAVQILGWLELPWDNATICAITGMNDEYIPGPKSHDALLSDGVRGALHLANDASRFARDCYLMHVIAHTKDHLTLVSARRDQSGSPLVPSRLLLRCDDASLASRMRRASATIPEPTPTITIKPLDPVPPSGISPFPVLPCVEHDPVSSMRVTSFKTYIRSPYLFFLQHVLSLSEATDSANEIGPMEYGNIVHSVLESFGRSDCKDSRDERVVDQYVQGELSRIRETYFATDPLPAVALQLRLLEFRLSDFAAWQASRARQGWTIEHVEWQAKGDTAGITVDGEVMVLRGKIDRIDRNGQTGAVCVIDYKSGREVNAPEKTHRNRSGWTDLQLPLYRHLARDILANATEVELAYVALPRRAEGVKLLKAEWDDADLQAADEAASAVIRAIREGRFDDPGDLDRAAEISRSIGALSGITVTHSNPDREDA